MRHYSINIILIALCSLISLITQAQPNDISLEQAQVAVKAAIQKATELDSKMDICVVDVGGNLKAFARMDGTWLLLHVTKPSDNSNEQRFTDISPPKRLSHSLVKVINKVQNPLLQLFS